MTLLEKGLDGINIGEANPFLSLFFLFMVIGFFLSMAKSIQPPILIVSENCLDQNKPLFGLLVGLAGAGITRGWIDTQSIAVGLGTVDLKMLRNIVLSWVCTIPGAMAISAGLYAALRVALTGPF